MNEILDFLNENAGALTVIFTAVVTLSTVAYATLTRVLVSETRKMRRPARTYCSVRSGGEAVAGDYADSSGGVGGS